MLHRFIQNRLENVFRYFPCVLLTGARQVGKTTLVKDLVPAGAMVTFDPVEDIRAINHELERYSVDLTKKKQIIAANKIMIEIYVNIINLFYLRERDKGKEIVNIKTMLRQFKFYIPENLSAVND